MMIYQAGGTLASVFDTDLPGRWNAD